MLVTLKTNCQRVSRAKTVALRGGQLSATQSIAAGRGSKMSEQKNKSDFKAKSMAEIEERGLLVVEILASAAKMVL